MKLSILFILVALSGYCQVTSSSITKADIIEITKRFKANKNAVSQEMRLRFPINKIRGNEYVSFLAKAGTNFDAAEMRSRGIDVGARIDNIVSIRYPITALNEIFWENTLSYIKIAAKIKPMLDKVAIGTHVDSVWAGIGLPQGYTGKDVIIGITDWGFDYTHPMFYDTLLQNSRILAAWDQFKTSGPSPALYGYGTEYNTFNELETAGSDTSNFYGFATHGSHVAGIAGGSGAGLEYRGMAFESEYLFVTFQFDESFVLDAWEWMHNKATTQSKRLVVSMSWGIYHMGALDGTDILSQAIDSYSAQGVLFVSSAGNNGNVNFHIEKDFAAADTLKSRIEFDSNTGTNGHWGQSIHLWGESGDEFSCQLLATDFSNNIVGSSQWFASATTPNYIDSFAMLGTDTLFFNLSTDASYPSNGRPHMRLRVKFDNLPYWIGIKVTAPSGIVHMWNLTELSTDVGNWGRAFLNWGSGSTSGDNMYGVGVPACANTAVAVGAYSSEYYSTSGNLVSGAGASFSSNGPLMDGSLKPDITAPGVNVASSISSFTNNSFSQIDAVNFNGRTYPFARFSGTSMSGPVCAGVAALMLDANPFLSADQLKSIIIATARTDNYTGTIPPHNTKWGWGKLNAYQAVKMATTVVGINNFEKNKNWIILPNPATATITIEGLDGPINDIKIIDVFGNIVLQPESANNISIEKIKSGVYFLRLIVGNKVEQRRFIKAN